MQHVVRRRLDITKGKLAVLRVRLTADQAERERALTTYARARQRNFCRRGRRGAATAVGASAPAPTAAADDMARDGDAPASADEANDADDELGDDEEPERQRATFLTELAS